MKGSFSQIQKVGKALMTPVAALPAAALLLRFGVLLDIPIMTAAGDALFANLAIIFAIGVAFGLAKNNQGVAALAGYIGYEVMTGVATTINPDINMGVLAGMVAGIIAGSLYNKFNDLKLPDWLGFFGGKRSVPIITSFVMIAVGAVFGYIWPIIQNGIDSVGNWMIGAGAIGVFVFGFLNRLLIPFGLHHVLNSITWFVFGEFDGATGDLNRFFAGDPTAGQFMTGFFPIMMFGLPAVALAIYFSAKKQNRSAVGGMLFSVAFTSFLTGITEPLEFMFMFLAPVLYAIHAVLTGAAMAITELLGIKHGFGFSAGAIDYVVNFNLATKPLLLIPIGLIFAVVYFVIFRWAIEKFNLPTPGRLDDETGNEELMNNLGTSKLAVEYFNLIGGKDNIVDIDACITRLRLTLKDTSMVTEEKVKALGAAGLIKPNKTNIQIVVGTKAEIIAEEMKTLI
jgi:PTS system N-acetylglucosamine-specific IIC component